MRTPGRMRAPPPTQTSAPISIGLPYSSRRRRLGVHWMYRRQDLHTRSEERVRPDSHATDIEHDAVEVEEHPLTQLDVRPVVAEKGRLHQDGVTAAAEESAENISSRFFLAFSRRVQRLAQVARTRPATSSGSKGS